MDYDNRSLAEYQQKLHECTSEYERMQEQVDTLLQERRRFIRLYSGLKKKLHKLLLRKQELEDLINVDSQTGLPIRRCFIRDLEEHIANMPSNGGLVVGVVRLDNQYRRIRVSRDRSNALLYKSGLRMKSVVGDYLYQSDRFDEFLFFVSGAADSDEAYRVGRRLLEFVSMHHDPPAEDISFGCIVGMSQTSDGGASLEELLDSAAIAVDRAEHSPDPVVLFKPFMGNEVRKRRRIERALSDSMQDSFRDFFIEYQAIVTPDGLIAGAEALLRLETQELGTVSPSAFIPIAEENGDIRVIGQWLIFECCRRLQAWRNDGYTNFQLSVNLSPLQFKQRDLPKRIEGVLAATGLDAGALKIELTESMIMQEPELAVSSMQRLRDLGVTLLIDDFGTGYSSLAYLRKFPVDVLKIDKSFVDGICDSESDRQIVKAIISMARSLKLSVLAEGVESRGQLEILRELECDYIQGYFFARPVSDHEFTAMLSQGRLSPQNDVEHFPGRRSSATTAVEEEEVSE